MIRPIAMRALAPILLLVALAPTALGGCADRALAQDFERDSGGQRADAASASQRFRGVLAPRRVESAKIAIAVGGLVLLGWGGYLSRAGRAGERRRLRDALLIGLGVAGFAAWWNFLQFHYPRFFHESDAYHYVVGAKYFPELGYSRLYACAVLADERAGLGEGLAKAHVRDLATNQVVEASQILSDPSQCTERFSDARWQAFQRDIAWFRNRHAPQQWRRVHLDHGYNATPAWTLLGWWLTNLDAPPEVAIARLVWLDPLLLLAMWACVAWAFGWRILCVAWISWGTIQTAAFAWTGGGILRQGWLATMVIGICLLRRQRPFGGGFLLAWAALLRVFPGLVLAGLGLQALLEIVRRRQLTLSLEHRRIALGALLAVAIALPSSAYIAGGVGVWRDFVQNSRTHLDTPLRNYLGLKTLLSYDHATRTVVSGDQRQPDRFAVWKQGRHSAFERRRPYYYALCLGFACLFVAAVRDQPAWVAATLGIGWIPFSVELTGYYYSLLLIYAFLCNRATVIGPALCAFSALSWLSVSLWHSYDESYTWTSLAALSLTVAVTGSLIWAKTNAATPESES